MAKIDDSVKKKVPELRFKGFTDEWEECKLGEFSDVRDGTHASPKYVSQGHPMVTSKNLTHSGLDMTDVSFLTDEDFNEINKRSKVSIGDILFGMIGTIGNPVIVDRDDFAIKNVALIKEKTSNPITNKWLLQYLKSPSFNRFIQKENAGGTQKFIALGLIRDMKLRVPEFDEQQKIGAFFKKIDETIALHQRKLAKLKELKQGYLQKLFPKNGSKFPQLRFSGFADDWEQRKLEKVFDTITDYVANGSFESLRKNVNSSDINGFAYLVRLQDASNNWQGPWLYTDQHGYEFLKKSRLQPDDIIMANVGSVGKFFLVPKLDKPMTLAPNAVLIKSSENDQGFLYQMMLTPEMQYKIFEKTTPGAQSKINKTDFKMIETRLPNMDEQKKIGAFFKQLDDTIALHQRKLDLLKEQKKGFLQKMFV